MIFVLPFVIQAVVMGVDEAYCHRRRELRKWERVGHPLDTVLYLVCLLWLLFNTPDEASLSVYVIFSLLSCLFITKDEWQHRELCTGFENWLHALLFMLHPLLLLTAGEMWWTEHELFQPVILTVTVLSALFAGYQIVYWNWIRD